MTRIEPWDQRWVEICQRYFHGVRTNYRESGFPSLPDFVIHEIWKRDPRVEGLRKVVEGLCGALEACELWHQGDKWRNGPTPRQVEIWADHRDRIAAALLAAREELMR